MPYTSPLNLQLPEKPRLNPRGNEAVAAEFQTVYNALRYLVQGIGAGVGTGVAWGNITGSISSQLDLVTALNAKIGDAPADGNLYGRKNNSWTIVPGGGGSGTVTSVGSGTGLTGGPITTSGTLSIANTSVAAGSYTNANITVNAQGQLTSASSGSPASGGILPLVTGEVPPVLVYLGDGSLVYTSIF